MSGIFRLALALTALGAPAAAHVSERVFVGLMPTDVYITAGVTAVALTVVALFFTPDRWIATIFRAPGNAGQGVRTLRHATSLAGFLVLCLLLVAGAAGPSDPLRNPLPLAVWTLWWIGMPFAQAVFGDLWAWVNPWTGLHRLVFGAGPAPYSARRLGYWPALAGFVVFAFLMLADPAPDDPRRLVWIVAEYFVLQFALTGLFGVEWLRRGECFTVYFSWLSKLSPFCSVSKGFVRMPGARLTDAAALPLSGTCLVLTILATGSFDGLNETFWWLARIGVNPLAFPGRSAVMVPNSLGLFGFATGLIAVFSSATWVGLLLARRTATFEQALGRLVFAILPIALGYHFAHFLTTVMVNGQYALAAATDPFGSGADFLGLGNFYVTTGFFNTRASAEAIWLAQAGAIVIGHVVAVLLAHAIALEIFRDRRATLVSQIPVVAFMVLYTLFGLWILASPVGA
ncbi:MAG: hypothetical protein ACE5FS_05710 [Paracoccaceae bacterium]